MKLDKGITLISLVVTIIILLIIAGTATYTGLESIKMSQKTNFITELEIVQAKVNTIYEKRKTNPDDITYYNSLGEEPSKVDPAKLQEVLKGLPSDGFRYFSLAELAKLDLDNITQEVIINYDTREVISLKGLQIDDVMYYKLKDIPGYTGYQVEQIKTIQKQPTFSVETNRLEKSWQIILKDIVYDNSVTGGNVSYKLQNQANWILVGEKTSFEVTEPGLYEIRLMDKNGNSATTQTNIDYISSGLIAHYDGIQNSESGHDENTKIWKDLSGKGYDATLIGYDETKWLEDGLSFNGISQFASVELDLGKEVTNEITLSVTLNIADIQNYRGIMGNHGESGNIGILMQFANQILENSYGNGSVWSSNQIDGNAILNQDINITNVFKVGEYIKTYINGKLVSTKKEIADTIIYKNSFYIGKAFDSSEGRLFQGTIRNVKIYNRILKDNEIKNNYAMDQYRFGI